ncbi:DMT family transporter [uncultured Cocleimonas sp.]|uniref:DMT family transporter n=1 Tax=uncultured Cocleimonas sp. TaxID=1051587 RepID=UPI002622AEAC|nr:DMT family transporter [uncultured Cocleimonas sp.]
MKVVSAPQIPDRVNFGILLILIAYLFFSLTDGTTKWLVLLGYPAFQLAFIRYGFQLAIGATEISFRGFDKNEIKDHFWLLVFRGAMLASVTACVFYSLKYLTLSMYSAILFTVPIFVSLISGPILGERVGPWRWFAIFMGFVGVVIIVSPFNESFHWASFLVLFAAIAMAIYSIITRKLAAKVRPHVLQFFTGLVGTLTFLPFAIWLWQPVTLKALMLMTWVGFASWAGHELLTRAHKHAEASVLMPYSYSFIIYMTILGFIFYDEVPDEFTILGALVIIISGLIIWYRERRLKIKVKRDGAT